MASGVSSSPSSSSLTFTLPSYRRALDDRLTEKDDLRVILDWLNEATPEWRHIGVQLGLEVHELNRIGRENAQDLKLCFQRVIIKRFQKGDLTWKILLQALESDAVGLKKLAFKTNEKLRDANSRVRDMRHTRLIATISNDESKPLKDGNNHDSTINMTSPVYKSATSQLSDLNNLTSASPDLSSNGTATLKPENIGFVLSELMPKLNYEETNPRKREKIMTGPIMTAIKENELMGEHDSYHQRISAKEAERRLKMYGGNRCYLTRFSQAHNHYVLSVRQKIPTQEIEHYGIDIRDGKYKIQGKEDIFNDITQMFEHYEQKRLDPAFKNIGKMFTEEDYLSALNRNPLMGEHPSYHQSMSAEEAEQRLKKFDGDCCYLTRFCEADRKYMLSVSQKRPTQSIKHFQINIQDGKCRIFERTEVFDDITQMLQHYEQNRLDPAFKTIGRMFTEYDYTIALNKTLMEEHTSYHQTVGAEEAERRLKKCDGDCCYLTRYCEADGKYVLSVSQKRPTLSIKHFQIDVRDGKCNIHEKPDVFNDITQMLQHYEHNRLDPAFKTIGRMFTEDDYTIALNKTLMEEHTSYHQTIGAEEAEQRLKKCGRDRCYLTRYCDEDKNYVLSVRQKMPTRVIKHFKIEVRNGKCNIHDKPDVFDDITQMLQHYEQNKLDSAFMNIGTIYTEENYNSSKGCQIL